MSLNNLAVALDSLYQCNGGIGTLTEATSLHREALGLRPAPHPDRSMSLNNLANALQSLYKCNGGIGTLTESLMNLADALLAQFNQSGGVDVLNEAVSLRRKLLALRPPGHRYRWGAVRGLVELLEKRHGLTEDDRDQGEIEDLKAELATVLQ
ncbi:hypothetical protein EST38_g9086 [Candolleomyces aberdarensis]|uniref:Uncharacterized protein n=1 Tax=Candolleomyces aberdarensis TaxID=2316362 RepID=A0A4Q2DDN6_9AGAR|nr:hypothetical protein EST38_g9086 [Candolleomyces aberdarensis]